MPLLFDLHDICRKYFLFLSKWSIFPNGPYDHKLSYVKLIYAIKSTLDTWIYPLGETYVER